MKIQNTKYKIQDTKQRGIVSIYITMMIMIVSLAMVLGLTVIFVGHLKIVRGMGDSVVAFYAANTGVEKLLYLRTLPSPPTETSGVLINGATYSARFSVQAGREYFESIGTFEGARRAISVSR